MTSLPEATERVWATVPRSVNEEIETRAAGRRLEEARMDPKPARGFDGTAATKAARLPPRTSRVWRSIWRPASSSWRRASFTRTAPCSPSASRSSRRRSTPISPPCPRPPRRRRPMTRKRRAKHRYVFAEAEAHFNRRNDELFAALKAQRDEAKVKSRALGRPFQAHGRRDRRGLTMARHDQRRRRGRFIGPLGRGFGVYWNRTGHRLRAYGFGALALIACWLVIVPGYVWIVQPGLQHWRGGAMGCRYASR